MGHHLSLWLSRYMTSAWYHEQFVPLPAVALQLVFVTTPALSLRTSAQTRCPISAARWQARWSWACTTLSSAPVGWSSRSAAAAACLTRPVLLRGPLKGGCICPWPAPTVGAMRVCHHGRSPACRQVPLACRHRVPARCHTAVACRQCSSRRVPSAAQPSAQAARDMTDDSSYRKLERSVRGCTDWYFWHMCSSRAQEERLRAFNLPACDTILSEVRPSLHRCSVLHGAPCHVYAHARLQLRRSRLHMHAQAATRRDAPVSQESE
jgi:hypothetical protein